MDSYLYKLQKQLPPLPDNHEVYSSENITLFKAQRVFAEPICLNCFEFVIPSHDYPPTVVEKKQYLMSKDTIFPINPGQSHHATAEKEVSSYLPIFVDTRFMEELSHTINGCSDVYFANDNFSFTGQLQNLIVLFIEEIKNRQSGYQFVLQNVDTLIAVSLLRQLKNNLSIRISDKKYTKDKNINRAIDFLWERYMCDFSLEEVAREASLSPYYFIKVFKDVTGKTPFAYLTDIKIKKATEFLKDKSLSITEICYLCGFSNPSHFTSVFKKKIGVSPSDYRNKL